METRIDAFSTNGAGEWTADAGVTVELCGWPDLIAGYNDASLMVRFPAGSVGKRVGKVLPTAISIAGAEDLVLSVVSLRAPTGPITRASDARYALDVKDGAGVTTRFYVPSHSSLASVDVPAAGITSVKEFWVYCLHSGEDQVVLSEFLAVKDETPLDLLAAVKLGIEEQIVRLMGRGIPIGTASFEAGSTTVTVDTDWSWVERYAVLQFVSGALEETHQANNAVGNEISLTDLYDGTEMLYAMTSAQVYLMLPVEIGRLDREILLPGVCVWYNGPDPEPRTGRLTEEVMSATATSLFLKRDGLSVKWRVTLDNEARSPELIALATGCIRAFLARGVVWIHGKKFWFEWTDPAVPVEPVEAYDIIPKSAYSVDIVVKEESWTRISTVRASQATTEIEPSGP